MTIWSPRIPPDLEPKYQALLDALQADIEAGVLAPGTRLPTQRELASRLGIRNRDREPGVRASPRSAAS